MQGIPNAVPPSDRIYKLLYLYFTNFILPSRKVTIFIQDKSDCTKISSSLTTYMILCQLCEAHLSTKNEYDNHSYL